MTYSEVHTTACHSGMDGDCNWSECPQNRDGEPVRSGRSCPLWGQIVEPWSAQPKPLTPVEPATEVTLTKRSLPERLRYATAILSDAYFAHGQAPRMWGAITIVEMVAQDLEARALTNTADLEAQVEELRDWVAKAGHANDNCYVDQFVGCYCGKDELLDREPVLSATTTDQQAEGEPL